MRVSSSTRIERLRRGVRAPRVIAAAACFACGLLAVFVLGLSPPATDARRPSVAPPSAPCGGAEHDAPERIAARLESDDVGVRRDMLRRLLLSPGAQTSFYDFWRDADFPARADEASITRVNLDDDEQPEAVLTFARYRNPVAIVLNRTACGWQIVGVLGAWLRFEDTRGAAWLELPETVRRGARELLMRESTGDGSCYSRRARLLKLIDERLVTIAEYDEECIAPLAGYNGADWADVKRRAASRVRFAPSAAAGEAARIEIETTDEAVRYAGVAPPLARFGRTDDAWHAEARHWRERPRSTIKEYGARRRAFVWDEQRRRFVPADE